MSRKVCVIGAGFAGLSAATTLASLGYEVQLVERHKQPGGRARQLSAKGFQFDRGPSWYWMPDVMERYFNRFNRRVSQYLRLKRLDPSYRIIFGPDMCWDIPAGISACTHFFERQEAGAGKQLRAFMLEAQKKYRLGMQKLVYHPNQSLLEYRDLSMAWNMFRLSVFGSMRLHVARYFKHPWLRQLMEFPVLFLGASPSQTPALYSLMNYADMVLGTWYPLGGMYSLVQALERLAREQGVKIHYACDIAKLETQGGRVTQLVTHSGETLGADIFVSAADYAHTETLLPERARNYSSAYWTRRRFAPSSLLYYIGVNKRLPGLLHHNLFFDTPFEAHLNDIYTHPQWPKEPLFYASVTTKTDAEGAPEGCENLFLLIPTAAGLVDDDALRTHYKEHLLTRLERHCQTAIRPHILYESSYGYCNFVSDYHACQGNAYGLANTLRQTAFGKPPMRSPRVSNLFFCGQLTSPGPGVPPSLVSGQVVAELINTCCPI